MGVVEINNIEGLEPVEKTSVTSEEAMDLDEERHDVAEMGNSVRQVNRAGTVTPEEASVMGTTSTVDVKDEVYGEQRSMREGVGNESTDVALMTQVYPECER